MELQELNNDRTKALFVDDEENILKSLKRLLMDEDIDILTATSGEQGLDVLRNTPEIGLIVSDQRMPGLLGADFLRQSREITPDALRIMLTGYADITATIDAINKGGAYLYINKPWDDEEMIRTIRDAVRQCRLISENKRLTGLVQKQNEELKEWNSNLKGRVLGQTAAIRNSNEELHLLNDKLQKNYENCLSAFYGLVELRDREAKNHSRNVARLSVVVAEMLRLPLAEIELIKVAALLHDIGKIGMSYRLLQVDADGINLDGNEEYRQHAAKGQSVIDPIEELRPAGVLIRHHHENFDGSGFPDRLNGEDIPTGSRIIALADCFDRLFTRNRSDKPVETTLQTIETWLGKKFDFALFPLVKQAAIDIYSKMNAAGKLSDPVHSSFVERTVRGIHTKQLNPVKMVEKELDPNKLKEGMIIAREVRNAKGLLLLGVGECIDMGQIQALRYCYQTEHPGKGILVRFPSENSH